MKHQLFACSLLVVVAAMSGCAMCGSPFDYSYAAHGGLWDREDRESGRVGSAFDPAGPMPSENGVAGPSAPAPANMQTPPSQDLPPGGDINRNAIPPQVDKGSLRSADAAPSPGMLFQ